MPGTTPRGYPYPLTTEPADGAPQIEALARAIDTDMAAVKSEGVLRFANAAARDAAIPAPVDGMVCWLSDLHQMQTYRAASRYPAGWYPTGGTLPGGWISTGAPQSFTSGTWQKINFAGGGAPYLQGGLVWDAANNAFTGPPGLYSMTLHAQLTQVAAGDDVIFAYGGLTALGSAISGGSVPGNYAPRLGASMPVELPASAWFYATQARSLGSRFFTVQYESQSA